MENSDEQAAAIRRELDARSEKISEMEKVSIVYIATFSTGICTHYSVAVHTAYRLGRYKYILLLVRESNPITTQKRDKVLI